MGSFIRLWSRAHQSIYQERFAVVVAVSKSTNYLAGTLRYKEIYDIKSKLYVIRHIYTEQALF